jgi:hypothetical protein
MLGEIDNENYVRKPRPLTPLSGALPPLFGPLPQPLGCCRRWQFNYDHRERGTLIEGDRFAALNATGVLREGYQQLSVDCLERNLNVTCKSSYAASGSQVSQSTGGREIMYVVAHAVHHYALIGIMGGLMGMKMPAGFGVAPSTVKHQADMANADRG